jgi:hypothetical protein
MEIPVNVPDGPSEREEPEHRRHPRRRVIVSVEIQSEGSSAPLRVMTADLSMSGLYVEMMFTLEVGTKVKIVLWLDDVKVNTGGVVVTRDLQVGNGIEFSDMAPKDQESVANFLAL